MNRMQRRMALLLSPACLAAGAAWSGATAESSRPAVCSIRPVQAAEGLRLEAVVSAAKGSLAGSYELVVTKSGGGGSSDVTQGGDFAVGPGEEAVLGEVTLGPGGKVKARLTVSPTGGPVCTGHYPPKG